MDGAAVTDDEATGLVKPSCGDVAEIDGQLEPGNVSPRQLEGMLERFVPQTAATRCRSQAEVDDLPDIAVWDLGQQQYGRSLRLAWNSAQSPPLGHKSSCRAMSLQNVIKLSSALQFGHVETALISCL